MKRIILLGLLFLFLPTSFAKASIVFTEIMYDPPTGGGSSWIEVYNNGSQPVDLTKYYLYVDSSSNTYGTQHGITQKGTGTNIIPSNGYAIIADDELNFLQTNSNLIVFDSSFSFSSKNLSYLTITSDKTKPPAIYDDKTILDPNQGGKNDGNSLQKNSDGTWTPAQPTPGYTTNGGFSQDSVASGTQSYNVTYTTASGDVPYVATNSTTSIPTSAVVSSNNPQAVLVVPKAAIAGVPVLISPSIVGINNFLDTAKSFHVTLGDGTQHYDSLPNDFEHTYAFPGTYVVNFEYTRNPYSKNSVDKLSTRKIIEVTAAPVVISKVNLDGSIEILNPWTREIDISNWILRSLSAPDVYFIIPDGTVILPSKKIIFAREVTLFSTQNTKSLELSLPSGAPVAVYDGDGTVGQDNQNGDLIQTTTQIIDPDVSQTLVMSKARVATSKMSSTAVAYANTLSEKDLIQNTQANSVDSNNSFAAQVFSSVPNSRGDTPYIIIFVSVGVFGIIIASVFVIRSIHKDENKTNGVDQDDSQKSAKEIADSIRIIDDES